MTGNVREQFALGKKLSVHHGLGPLLRYLKTQLISCYEKSGFLTQAYFHDYTVWSEI